MCKLNIHRLVYATKTRQRAKVFHALTTNYIFDLNDMAWHKIQYLFQ